MTPASPGWPATAPYSPVRGAACTPLTVQASNRSEGIRSSQEAYSGSSAGLTCCLLLPGSATRNAGTHGTTFESFT